jgi:LemA protein
MFSLLLAAAGFVVVVIAAMLLIIYNTLVALRNGIGRASADIDVLLEKRHDLIGRLVDVVKGYSAYEKSVLVKVTQIRTQWATVQDSSINEKMQQSNQISAALKSIFAVAENYPDLKADKNFLELQSSIYEIETQIADRREFYNDSVYALNTKIQQVPYNLLAGNLGFKAVPFLQVPEDEKAPVNVDM